MKKIIEGEIKYDNHGNSYFAEWWSVDGDACNRWLKEFEGKIVKITVEEA